MEDLMLGIGTNCMTAAVILWETTDLQWFPATLAVTAAAAFLIGAREMVKKMMQSCNLGGLALHRMIFCGDHLYYNRKMRKKQWKK